MLVRDPNPRDTKMTRGTFPASLVPMMEIISDFVVNLSYKIAYGKAERWGSIHLEWIRPSDSVSLHWVHICMRSDQSNNTSRIASLTRFTTTQTTTNMPPKGQPRRRQPGRSTRSTAVEDESAEAVDPPSEEQSQTLNNMASQDDPMDTEADQTVYATPKEAIRGSAGESEIPTIPAIEAPRRPVQRLTSVLPQNLSSGISSTPGASDGRPSGLKFQPKSFMRRNKEERERIEKADAEQRAARQAAEEKRARGDHQGRGRGRGGTEDMSGFRRSRFEANRQASGPMGGPVVRESTTPKHSRGGGRRSGPRETSVEVTSSSSPKITTRVKKEPTVKPETDKDGDVVMKSMTTKRKRTAVKKEEEVPIYVSDEADFDSDKAPRISIENFNTINLISDEESDDEQAESSEVSKGKRREATPKPQDWSMRPIRVERQEHVDRAVGVNTEASSLTSAELRRRAKERQEAGDSLFLPEEDEIEVMSTARVKGRRKPKDVEFLRNERKWKGVYMEDEGDPNGTKVKEEPKDDDVVMVADEPVQDKVSEPEPEPMVIDEEDSTSGQISQKELAKALTQAGGEAGKTHDLADPAAVLEESILIKEPKNKRPKIIGFHNLNPSPTPEGEDEDEDEGRDDPDFSDLQILVEELDNATNLHSSHAPETIDDEEPTKKSLQQTSDSRNENIYLFQLPPLIPKLRDTSNKDPKPKSEAKKPPIPPLPEPTNPFHTHPKDIKPPPSPPPTSPPTQDTHTALPPPPPPGLIGTLTIFTTNRALASWGGTSFEVSAERQETGLAQEVLMTEYASAVTKVEERGGWEEVVRVGKEGWSCGDVEGGFVGVPELGGLLG